MASSLAIRRTGSRAAARGGERLDRSAARRDRARHEGAKLTESQAFSQVLWPAAAAGSGSEVGAEISAL
jgi:hypothetical protein